MTYDRHPPTPAAGLRNKLAERARPFLEPGEHIQAIFRAQNPSPYFWQFPITFLIISIFITWNRVPAVLWETMAVVAVALWIVYFALFRVHHIVVTDRAIVVLDTSKWAGIFPPRMNRPTRLRLRRPRDFYFGQLSGLFGKFVLDNTEYWVHRRFHNDVTAADVALTQMTQR
jgi:hypothetical protein